MPVSGRRLALVALMVTMIVWGSTFVVTKSVLDEAGPFAVTALRFGIGLLVLLPFAYRRGFRVRLALKPAFLLFGLTGVVLYFGLQNLALVFTSAANAALISAGVPVAAALLARVFLKERIPLPRLFGIGLSVIGVLLVSDTTPSGGAPEAILGNALMVVAVVGYGAYGVQGRAMRGRALPGGRGDDGELRGGAPLPPPARRGRGPPLRHAAARSAGVARRGLPGCRRLGPGHVLVEPRAAVRARERRGALHQPGPRRGRGVRPAVRRARRCGATRRRGARRWGVLLGEAVPPKGRGQRRQRSEVG